MVWSSGGLHCWEFPDIEIAKNQYLRYAKKDEATLAGECHRFKKCFKWPNNAFEKTMLVVTLNFKLAVEALRNYEWQAQKSSRKLSTSLPCLCEVGTRVNSLWWEALSSINVMSDRRIVFTKWEWRFLWVNSPLPATLRLWKLLTGTSPIEKLMTLSECELVCSTLTFPPIPVAQ